MVPCESLELAAHSLVIHREPLIWWVLAPDPCPRVSLIWNSEWRRQLVLLVPAGKGVYVLSSCSLGERVWEPWCWAFELLMFWLCCCSLIMHVAPPFLCRLQPRSGRICPRYVHSWLQLLLKIPSFLFIVNNWTSALLFRSTVFKWQCSAIPRGLSKHIEKLFPI